MTAIAVYVLALAVIGVGFGVGEVARALERIADRCGTKGEP